MDELNKIIGKNLISIRKNRNLSLDEVSDLTGVSKGMISQIEKGKSNPTVSTLWKISTGLKVPFSSFMESKTIDYEVINKDDIEPILEADNLMKIYTVFPFDSNKNFEILTIDLEGGCTHSSPKHADLVEEYIIVNEGTLTMDFGKEPLKLEKGNCIRFLANTNHTYKNETDKICTFVNIIVYGKQ